jgi:hypothetical protein
MAHGDDDGQCAAAVASAGTCRRCSRTWSMRRRCSFRWRYRRTSQHPPRLHASERAVPAC